MVSSNNRFDDFKKNREELQKKMLSYSDRNMKRFLHLILQCMRRAD